MADYKDTLNLPKTDFSMRAGLAKKEPQLLAHWHEQNLYQQIQTARKDAPLFLLHDGPPYANGHLHHGHMLNKILKDIVLKDRSMAGFRTPYVPGWDCHGLPIEVQVDKSLGKKKLDMSTADIRSACRSHAEEFVDIQKEEFQRLGIFGRWDTPYTTMNFAYEAQTVRELARFVEQDLLYKGLRPVNWCTVHQTALAEAEVEYDDHKSPSIYVAMQLENDEKKQALGLGDEPVDIVIWTTTPWTLPANLAVCVNPELDYIVYNINGRLRIFAEGRAEAFLQAIAKTAGAAFDATKVEKRIKGKALEGLVYKHPFLNRRSPVILGDHATLEAGTGCVHTAPGHGADDFDVGRRYGLDVLSPVDAKGVLNDSAGAFAGLQVFAANKEIINALEQSGALLSDPGDTIKHRYAHCWRCHKPIIQRATEQWWVAVDKPFGAQQKTLREQALSALARVDWVPGWGEDRIRGMLTSRPDWCLSRQRIWGVPIVAFYCKKCDAAVLEPELMHKVADVFAKEGADAWYIRDTTDFLGERTCSCGHTEFRKETDILDVWFDSGVSFAAVVEQEGLGHDNGESNNAPIDLYLEGSDQHRGWFQSSMLCSLATRERPPFKRVLTHGFVVDGKGKKLAKSSGNFADPFKSINQNGAELLRLWVAAEDYRGDIHLSQEILKRQTETYRKLRNTLRYMLGNINDFDPQNDMVPFEEMLPLDQYALGFTAHAIEQALSAYARLSFHQVIQTMTELCSAQLSSFYFDILKDRLYCSGPASSLRRSAQTALYMIARDVLRTLAPIFCFTAEEAWGHLAKRPQDPASVHLTLYPGKGDDDYNAYRQALPVGVRETYESVKLLRDQVNGALEKARQDKLIGSSTEAAVELGLPTTLRTAMADIEGELADLLIVSQVHITDSNELTVTVLRATGTKCERCWLYREDVGSHNKHPDACVRCAEAL